MEGGASANEKDGSQGGRPPVRTVLLLEDDKALRALLRASLAVHGMEIVEAGRVRDAENILQHRPIDVVVVDGLLPDDQGLEFIERLRARDRDIRIVYCSAYFRDLNTFRRLTDALRVSLVAYKPVEPKSFAAQIAELAGVRAEGSSPPAGGSEDAGFALEIAELHRQFSDQLLEKVDAIEEALEAAHTGSVPLPRARDLAHALRGSAGSYGFAAVSEALGVVEYLLAEAASRDVPERPYFWEEARSGLREARRVASLALKHLRHPGSPG